MADATGSSSGAGAGAGAGASAGHGDLGRGITPGQYQAFLASSMNRIAPNAANVFPQTHQQYPIGLIPAQVGMSMPAARPMYSTQIVMPPQHRVVQTHQPPPPAGHYQHQGYSAYGSSSSSASPSLGFADWRMYNNALMSFGHQTPLGNINSNGNISLNSNRSPYSTGMWTGYAPMNMNQTYFTNYVPAATNDPALQAPSFHNNNNQQGRTLGFATGFGATALVPASPFELMSQRTTNSTSAQIFQGTGALKNEGSEASEDEADPAPELEAQNQLGQGVGAINATYNTILNCKDYRFVLRKDLTNSDVGNVGRIVLPKKDAEANLPVLVDNDSMILEMDDFELPDIWKFKYRYWPNNKSRMYILETAGEFVKKHSLEAGDIFVIYQHKRTGKQVARAVKVNQLSSNMNLRECQCMKEGNSGEECGFAVRPPAKKTCSIHAPK